MIATVLQHPGKVGMLMGVFLAGLLSLYIFQVNALTAQVYYIGDQEKRLEQVKEQSFLSEVQRLGSFSRAQMEELAQAMHFERVQHVSYLKILSGTVAANQE